MHPTAGGTIHGMGLDINMSIENSGALLKFAPRDDL